MANTIKHAILEQWEGLYYLHGGSGSGDVQYVELPTSIEQFIPLFEQCNSGAIWVMPGSDFSRQITWDYIGRYDHTRYNMFPDRQLEGVKDKKPTFMRLRRERKPGERLQSEYYLAFPEWEDWRDSGKSWDCPTAQTLLDTVEYVEIEQEMPCAWSPQNMGKNRLRYIHDRRGWKIEPTILTDYLKTVINRSVQRPTWVRDGGLTDEQKRKKWVIGGDKNGQYVGGTRNLVLGNGPYTRVGADRFDGKTPGLWYAQVTSVKGTMFNSYDLFCPWTAPKQWFSTDLLVAAEAVGIKYSILEGIIWEESGKYMDQWGKEIWEHRAAYFDAQRFPNEIARLNAMGTAKQIGNSFIGLVAKPQTVAGKGMIYRPDWNILIIHKAIANLMYSLKARFEKYGVLPVLLARGDTQWIVSDTPEVPGGLFDHQFEQRGWKPIGKLVPMSDEIIAMFAEPEGSGLKANETKASKIAAYLEQKAREQ
jgi:hypothetical protein